MHGKLLFGKIVAMLDLRWKLISICTLCEEGDYAIEDVLLFVLISIHALREEGDVPGADDVPHRGISIHALREEGDRAVMQQLGRRTGFLSTPSARRATT